MCREMRGPPMHRAPSFRRHTRWIALAAVFLFYPMAVSAAAESLPGWGPYIFGMSRSDVTKGGRVLLPGTGGPDLLDSARIDGQLYAVELYFRGDDQKLWRIRLHAALGNVNQVRCREDFEKIAEKVKKKYPGGEWKSDAGKAFDQIAAYSREFDRGSTLRILKGSVGGCDVNVEYVAPPLLPLEGKDVGF